MTENKAKKNLELLERCYRVSKKGSALHEVLIEFVTLEDLVEAIQALAEIQEYRAIGTVEEVKNAYGRGYNQGTIDRAEELQKCREYGYNKAIDEFAEVLKEKNKTLIIGNRMIDEIAEQLKGVQE